MPGRGKNKCKGPEPGMFLLSSESSRRSVGLAQSMCGEGCCRQGGQRGSWKLCLAGSWRWLGEDFAFLFFLFLFFQRFLFILGTERDRA